MTALHFCPLFPVGGQIGARFFFCFVFSRYLLVWEYITLDGILWYLEVILQNVILSMYKIQLFCLYKKKDLMLIKTITNLIEPAITYLIYSSVQKKYESVKIFLPPVVATR